MKADWRCSQAGGPAPFLSAFTSPLLTWWMNKLVFLTCIVGSFYSEENIDYPVVFGSKIDDWKWWVEVEVGA